MATAACGVLDYMYKQRIEFENGDSKANEDYQSALSQMRDKYKYTMCNIRDFDHFMNNFDRLSAQDYVPINEDILRTDKPLIGMTEAFFNVSGCEATFYDLGGCRGERRKWIHAFDDCNGVIFPVAMNKFDEYPINDQSAGSLQEALVLFESVINSRWFARCAIVLFFTKVDLFKEKIMSGQSKISENFPDYNGQPTDTQVAQVFFMDKFTKLAEAANAKKILYVHFINLLDCRMTKFAVSGIMDALFSCRFMIYP
ncbi:MAG: hypothetical protein M1820_004655 [Bogoriella megaspora]|nr:MAG: hypothetical protein M1820_004655 [Bogoriella megaspora]